MSRQILIGFILTNNRTTIRLKTMKTVSYSLDEETAEGIEVLAKQSKVSRSDIVRSLYARVRLENSLEEMQAKATPLLDKLGLHTEDDIVAYAKSKT